MSKRPKRRAPNGKTAKASSRIFYRNPWLMLGEFFWSGPGLVVAVLLYGASAIFIHIFA